MRPFTIALSLAVACAACSKTPEPEGSSAPPKAQTAQPAGTSAAAPQPAGPSGPADVTWEAPTSWQKADNPSPMRKATYKIPKAAGDAEDAEMSVSQAGGSVDANIKRWAGQFEQPPAPEVKKSERRAGDLKITVVEIHGTFLGGGMPGMAAAGPKKGWVMLAAIVETATPTFFKLTGPEKTVMAAKADFEKMVDGMRPR
jgi:hypothetical protein